jgi:CheY-like chemotaxis protein
MEDRGGLLEIALNALPANVTPLANTTARQVLELRVSDNGEGIEADNVPRIFDPFFTTKPRGKGTGLGLSVVHGIVEQHQGAIEVKSEVGSGTVFQVYFPITQDSAVAILIEAMDIAPAAGDGHILVVDDEEDLAVLYQDYLQNLGYVVTVYTDPREALTAFAANPTDFDLVFTDQTMPGMIGMDFVNRIRRVRADIPVIIATGYSHLLSMDTIELLGMAQFLQKPVSLKQLAKVMAELLVSSAK